MKYILPLFIILPFIEMYFLIKVGSYIGALNTIGLVFLTAIIGFFLIRAQGFRTLHDARTKLQYGELPAEELLTGIFLLISGICLVTPGFFTDSIGFLLLVPAIRKTILTFIPNANFGSYFTSSKSPNKKEDWIEGEFKKED
jgi:UPF0716 protein FxsA